TLGCRHRVERMHVTYESALLVHEVGDYAVVRVRRSQRSLLIGAEVGSEIAIEVQQAEVSPIAGVVLLIAEDRDAARIASRSRMEQRGVGDALILFPHEGLTQIE